MNRPRDTRTLALFEDAPLPRIRPLRLPVIRRALTASPVQLSLPLATLPTTRRDRGGNNPAMPCEGCPQRATCKAACDLLTAQLSPEELFAPAEISSPALMAGRGYDPQFMVQPEVEREPDEAVLWAKIYRKHGGKRLREALAQLTATQRRLVEALLAGKSRVDITRERGVARQSVHKVFHGAMRRLRKLLVG